MKKWIIFDAMGVVFEVGDDTNDLLVPFIQKLNPKVSKEFINEVYVEASLGNITSKEFWIRIGVACEYNYKDIEVKYLDECLVLDKDFIEVAQSLKNEYGLALLSNDVKEWSNYLRNKFELNTVFDIVIISGDVGLRKPDTKIYELFLERSGAKPEDCIFIDDRDKNLVAAMKLGIKGVKFLRDEVDSKIDMPKIKSFKELENVLVLI